MELYSYIFILLCATLALAEYGSPHDEYQNIKDRLCKNVSDLRLSIVGGYYIGGEQSTLAVKFTINVTSYISNVSRKFLPSVHRIDYEDNYYGQNGVLNVAMNGNNILFDSNKSYFHVNRGLMRKNIFGGWNSAFLGCPQSICVDPTLDAIVNNVTHLFAIRGKYVWHIGEGGQPYVRNAILREAIWPGLPPNVEAATSDAYGNLAFIDDDLNIHFYLKNTTVLKSIFDRILPGFLTLRYFDRTHNVSEATVWEGLTRSDTFGLKKTFGYEKIQNSIYYQIPSINMRHFNPILHAQNLVIRDAFSTKSNRFDTELSMYILTDESFHIFDIHKAIRIFFRTFVARHDDYFRTQPSNSFAGYRILSQYLQTLESERPISTDDRSSSFQTFTINSKFPKYITGAFSLLSSPGTIVYIMNNGHYYKLETSFFKSTNASTNQLSSPGLVFEDIFGCTKDFYTSIGVKNFWHLLQTRMANDRGSRPVCKSNERSKTRAGIGSQRLNDNYILLTATASSAIVMILAAGIMIHRYLSAPVSLQVHSP